MAVLCPHSQKHAYKVPWYMCFCLLLTCTINVPTLQHKSDRTHNISSLALLWVSKYKVYNRELCYLSSAFSDVPKFYTFNFNCVAVLFWLRSLTAAVETEYLQKVGISAIFKSLITLYDWLMQDERVQVNGLVYISDFTSLTMQKFTSLFNAEKQKDAMSYFEVNGRQIFT